MLKKIQPFVTNRLLYIFLILAFAFYWYSYRPYQISKLCIQIGVDAANTRHGDQSDARYYFWKCQKQHGITE